jgi:hypothetical protein
MPITVTPHSGTDALKASALNRKSLVGWRDAEIREVYQQESEAGNNTMVVRINVTDPEGNKHDLRDHILTDLVVGAQKLRNLVDALGIMRKYEQGQLDEADFAGRIVCVRIGINKRGPYAGRAVILDYRPSSSSHVVDLRAAE